MIENFKLVENNIYRGGMPTDKDLEILKNTYNIKRIISLDAAASSLSAKCAELKIEHIMLPIDPSVSTMTDGLRYLVRNIIPILTNVNPVFVHCIHGSDRTGFVIALYRVKKDNWNCDQAIGEARKYQYGQGIGPNVQLLYKNILCGAVDPTQPAPVQTTPAPVTPADTNASDDADIVTVERENRFNDPAAGPNWTPPHGELVWRSKMRTNQLEDIANAMDIEQKIPDIGEINHFAPGGGFGFVQNTNNL